MKGVLKAYNDILPQIVLHGPAAHAPCIKFFVDLITKTETSQEQQFYNIIIVLTRGLISDQDEVAK